MVGKQQDVLRLLENHKDSLERAEFRGIGLTGPPGWEVLREPKTFRASCYIKISVCYDMPGVVEEFSADHKPEQLGGRLQATSKAFSLTAVGVGLPDGSAH